VKKQSAIPYQQDRVCEYCKKQFFIPGFSCKDYLYRILTKNSRGASSSYYFCCYSHYSAYKKEQELKKPPKKENKASAIKDAPKQLGTRRILK
jgi:hypothetical protein